MALLTRLIFWLNDTEFVQEYIPET